MKLKSMILFFVFLLVSVLFHEIVFTHVTQCHPSCVCGCVAGGCKPCG
ncbi:hypothetical protein CH379_009030 [Leptospira ellisii]|uniref:Uncharacterized protein n=1 Tax=Leptospira ellisii TaxID=2023197 RepID=A0AAE4QMM4_9LEPT|nr:hypothetical protein [Leptospira ellisii]MDV6235768.1 hypothetical protein [Leptospira ellisii]